MRIVLVRYLFVHRRHNAGVILRAADRKHVRVRLVDHLGALAQAAGHDDLAVFVQGLGRSHHPWLCAAPQGRDRPGPVGGEHPRWPVGSG